MENATKLINELKEKVRQYEEKMLESVGNENLMEVDFVQSSANQVGAARSSHDIGFQAMREQIKFMAEKLVQTRAEIEEKEIIVKQIEMDKRQYQRKYENAEM